MKRHLYIVISLFLLASCDSANTEVDGPATPVDLGHKEIHVPRDGPAADLAVGHESGPPSDSSTPADGPADSGGAACTAGASSCVDQTQHKICKSKAGKLTWVTEICAAGMLCLDKLCAATCIDQCDLNRTRVLGGKTQTCKPFSVAQKTSVPVGSGMHDRARQHNAWIRKFHLPAGTIADTRFADTSYNKVVSYHGAGDSAIWTGTYLAGEALRLKVTGSPDAASNVQQLVEAIHRLFEVTSSTTPHPGFLARYTAPINSPDPAIKALYNPTDARHHKVKFKGQDYFWSGNTSRDQYQGVMLGYSLAYDALSSAKHKKLIRDDMVALCQELMKARKKVKVTMRFHALGKWQEMALAIDMEHVVMNPTEYKKGGPFIQLGTTAKPTDYESSTMQGFREFFPDYSVITKQLPLIGPLIGGIPIPRSGSAIMLANIFRIGIQVTKGVPGHGAQHAAIKAYYDKHKTKWLGLMKQYIFLNDASQCWKSYYGLNIVFEPVYNLIRLEDDKSIRASMQKDVLQAKLWKVVKDHKNVFFSYIYASQGPSPSTLKAVAAAASTQLAQFSGPPHARTNVVNTGKYPANKKCSNQSSVAIDVKHRVADDFIWQRQPFQLTKTGDGKSVYPGADFTLPYWMARHHGFLSDDAQGTCLRWQ